MKNSKGNPHFIYRNRYWECHVGTWKFYGTSVSTAYHNYLLWKNNQTLTSAQVKPTNEGQWQ